MRRPGTVQGSNSLKKAFVGFVWIYAHLQLLPSPGHSAPQTTFATASCNRRKQDHLTPKLLINDRFLGSFGFRERSEPTGFSETGVGGTPALRAFAQSSDFAGHR